MRHDAVAFQDTLIQEQSDAGPVLKGFTVAAHISRPVGCTICFATMGHGHQLVKVFALNACDSTLRVLPLQGSCGADPASVPGIMLSGPDLQSLKQRTRGPDIRQPLGDMLGSLPAKPRS